MVRVLGDDGLQTLFPNRSDCIQNESVRRCRCCCWWWCVSPARVKPRRVAADCSKAAWPRPSAASCGEWIICRLINITHSGSCHCTLGNIMVQPASDIFSWFRVQLEGGNRYIKPINPIWRHQRKSSPHKCPECSGWLDVVTVIRDVAGLRVATCPPHV